MTGLPLQTNNLEKFYLLLYLALPVSNNTLTLAGTVRKLDFPLKLNLTKSYGTNLKVLFF